MAGLRGLRQDVAAFGGDERGAVAIMTAITSVAVFGFAALALDTGALYLSKRKQQMATDLAALAAAGSLANASGLAASSVGPNGYQAADIASVELGSYVANPAIPAAQRFSTSYTGSPGAVRVTMRTVQPYLFGSIVGTAQAASVTQPPPGVAITTRSVAATRSLASASLGTGLAAVNSGILNSVLGSMLGSNLSLSLMDYQALASANIDLFVFSNALASRAHVTAGTYNALASGTVSLGAALGAVGDTAGSAQASAAIAAMVAAFGTQSTSLPLAALISYGPDGSLQIGSVKPLTATVSALDLVSALLQAANGQHQVDTALNVSLPGVVAASVKLAIGEPATASSLDAIGAPGTTLKSAQTRVRLSLQLAGPAQAPLLSFQIILNVAQSTASLTSLTCASGGGGSVVLGVTPGLVDGWIGAVSDQDLAALSTPLAPSSATFVNLLGLLKVTGTAHATIANTGATAVPFSAADILAGTHKTVSTTDFAASLLNSLFGNLALNISVLGFNVINVSALNTAILQTLVADVTPIDTILTSVLAAVGVSVGNATVATTGLQCGQSILVN